MIKTTLIGHIGSDATINNVQGRNVINFNVAHTEKFTNAQGVKTENTLWVQCAYWTDKTAIAQYLRKGTQVYVEGQPSVDMYKNKDGVHVCNLRLRVASVQLLGSKDNNQNQQPQLQSQVPPMGAPDDDLPF